MGYQLENVQEGSGDSRPGIFGRLSLYLSRDAAGRNLCLALLPKEDAEDKPTGSGFGGKTI